MMDNLYDNNTSLVDALDAVIDKGAVVHGEVVIRLADLEESYQEDAAKKMNISRQTFGNIIHSAHKKIADALINAKALKIEGGNIERVG